MNILHLCTYDWGGAGNAAIRLHEGLLEIGESSFFASKTVTSEGRNRLKGFDGRVGWLSRYSPSLEFHIARILYPKVRPVLPLGLLPGCGRAIISAINPDIINLHWIDHGFISYGDLGWLSATRKPVVWTLHDMAPLSGGFGYREAVDLPPNSFGPLLPNDCRAKIGRLILNKRKNAVTDGNFTIVAPSKWLAEEARMSPVFSNNRIEHIPYGIDTNIFKPLNSYEARNSWGLPLDSKIILFGADTFEDRRKGIAHLQAALKKMPSKINGKPILLVGFGNRTKLASSDFPIPVQGIGRLSHPADIAALYSAADVFVCPSREDNLPNTMVESLACGTPVVGFEIGGLKDLIIPSVTGYLAEPYREDILSDCLMKVLFLDSNAIQTMRTNCRQLAEEQLSLNRQAILYKNLYHQILTQE